MAASSFAYCDAESCSEFGASERLASLADLGSADIETPFVENLSSDLHALFDPVSDSVLPIYFGPLLGRLYLEGL